MAITYCTSYTLELLTGTHDFSSDDIKIALFDSNASFNSDTTEYTSTNEISSGDGYTTGGATLVLASGYPQLEDGVASVRWGVPAATWTFTAAKQVSWALIYNATKSNKAIMSIYIGNKNPLGAFSVTFPLSLPPPIRNHKSGT